MTQEEKFHGFTVGLNVPLWSNRGNVKRAKAQQVAVRSRQQDALLRLQSEHEAQKLRTTRLREYAERLQRELPPLSAKAVLHNAFQRGDIAALDYYVDLTADYDLRHKMLQAEREWQLAEALLAAF